MPAENYGEKAGEGVKGVFKSINDVGEALRTNINGALDGFGDAVTGNHAHSRGNTGISNDSEKVRRDMNKGIDDFGKKVENSMHHHKK